MFITLIREPRLFWVCRRISYIQLQQLFEGQHQEIFGELLQLSLKKYYSHNHPLHKYASNHQMLVARGRVWEVELLGQAEKGGGGSIIW